MITKRGQAAMEFLMTYGWAILVVLSAIGALAYFGVINQTNNVPDMCVFNTAGIACDGNKVTPTEITLVMRNGVGKSLVVNNIQVGDCSQTQDYTFNAGDQLTVTLDKCSNGNAGNKFSGDIIIGYTESNSGLTKTFKGSLTATIEEE